MSLDRNASKIYLVGFDPSVDEVKTLLDFRRDRRWSGNVVSLDPEAEFVSCVLHSDHLTIGRSVGIRTALDKGRLVLVVTNSLQVALLFSLDVVTGFVPRIEMQIECMNNSVVCNVNRVGSNCQLSYAII